MGHIKTYRVIADEMLGFSCLEPNGRWMVSVTTKEEAFEIIKKIQDEKNV